MMRLLWRGRLAFQIRNIARNGRLSVQGLVVDTDVVVAAFRSLSGASAVLYGLQPRLPSLAVALEHEAVCMLADHRLAANAIFEGLTNLLDRKFDLRAGHSSLPVAASTCQCPLGLEAAVNARADSATVFEHRLQYCGR